MKFINSKEWFPEHGAFQTIRENNRPVARHMICDELKNDFENISRRIYETYGLLQAETNGYWVYFR
jgi:hypothetical protein